ncbi:(2Fe-2S)-binding protein [Ruegeria sp. Ofav3-42]|uniref:(2Fe-2S)-binding protein n=1 Tax=Ruegeria sp. Ofav3-42 TaxID=2917759 RepID=UPI001EF597E6|nr:(2Fe-2S)-binding protein [Ruegeria sp. Ofav3-42]
MTKLTVNGQEIEVDASPDMPLLWALRDKLGLTGTKYGCGIAQCRACTVHIDGEAMPSCQIEIGDVGASEITTIEGLGEDGSHPVQRAWVSGNVPQCGFCQSGMVMAAVALLEKNPNPTDEEINDEIVNICRCGSYSRVRAAIHQAAAEMQKG